MNKAICFVVVKVKQFICILTLEFYKESASIHYVMDFLYT